MPIAVGMYLPFGLATPILIGGLIAHYYSKGTPASEHDRILHRGILFSSGVIAGEALMSVGLACLTALGFQSMDLGLPNSVVMVISVIAAFAVVICFVKLTRPQKLMA